MKVLHVATSHPGGGAERVAWDLVNGLPAVGVDAHLAVGSTADSDPRVTQIPNHEQRTLPGRLAEAIADRVASPSLTPWIQRAGAPRRLMDKATGREDMDHPGTAMVLECAPWRPDIMHLHNLHGGYFDLRELPALSRQLPVVVTLHDEWLYTGHCAYAMDCDGWLRGCGNCPDLARPPAVRRDRTAENLAIKREVFARSRLHIISPSQWLADRAERSELEPAMASLRVIPNGIDTTAFGPDGLDVTRQHLGVPQGHLVVLTSAQRGGSIYKGGDLLDEVVSDLGRTFRQSVVLGIAGEVGEPHTVGSIQVRPLGRLNRAQMIQWHQIADTYLHLARAENHPLTVLEALACGTPVVAVSVGGIPEQLILPDGARVGTGILVGPTSAPDAARAVASLLDDPARRRAIARAARDDATARFDRTMMVRRHVEAYTQIASSSTDPPSTG